MKNEIKEITAIIIRLQDEGRKSISRTEGVIVENKDIATALYKAGYRKQSETAKEFAERAKIKLTDKSGWVTHKCLDLCWEIDKIAKEFGVEE